MRFAVRWWYSASAGLRAKRGLSCAAVAAQRSAQTVAPPPKSPKHRERLVILGSGWGSFTLLHNLDKSLYDVTVVSRRNNFLFTPLLASTTVGTLEFRSISEPLRSSRSAEGVSAFYVGECVDVDTEKRLVLCTSPLESSGAKPSFNETATSQLSSAEASSHVEFAVPYDKLVIGVGALPNTLGISGVRQYTHHLKELGDARSIRQHLLGNIERAAHPFQTEEEKKKLMSVVVVGGGPTGVEFAAELHDFLDQDGARAFPGLAEYASVTLITADELLPSFDASLRQYAQRRFHREGIRVLSGIVSGVSSDRVRLSTGEEIEFGLCVWSTGIGPTPFAERVQLPKNKQSRIKVDNRLRVLDNESIYALGDCACVDGEALPATAQVADRQGQYLAKALNAFARGDELPPPFKFKSSGMLAYVGGYTAVANFPSARMRGFFSWILWRSVYLTKLGSWRNRFQVPFDWAKTFLFGRDINRF